MHAQFWKNPYSLALRLSKRHPARKQQNQGSQFKMWFKVPTVQAIFNSLDYPFWLSLTPALGYVFMIYCASCPQLPPCFSHDELVSKPVTLGSSWSCSVPIQVYTCRALFERLQLPEYSSLSYTSWRDFIKKMIPVAGGKMGNYEALFIYLHNLYFTISTDITPFSSIAF